MVWGGAAGHLKRSWKPRLTSIISSYHPQTEPLCQHSSTWLFKEVFEIWGTQSLLFVFVFSKVSQQGHDFIFKYFWGWFSFCGPVVNIPVITRLINQAVIEIQLLLCHVLQVFFSKKAKKNAVFQHSPLSALIEQAGSFGFYGFISSLLPWRQRDFDHVLLGICWAVTSVEASE